VVSFGALTEVEVLPPNSSDAQCGLHLLRGIVSFFHRTKRTHPGPSPAAPLPEWRARNLSVAARMKTERTTLSVIDGKVRFGNETGPRSCWTNGQQAVAEPGKAPVRTGRFHCQQRSCQWCFYYPAVIDLNDLPFTPEGTKNPWRIPPGLPFGDLLMALAKYPPGGQPGSDAERVVYFAGLLWCRTG